MDNEGRPAAIYADISWLPAGSYVEVWIGDVPAPLELSTAAFALAFDADGLLLLTNVLKRGLDIPGGHVEAGEAAEQAAVRETAEETGAAIRIVGKAGHLRIVVPKPPPDFRYPAPHAFQPFYAAVIEGVGPVQMPEECGPPVMEDPMAAAENPRFRLHRELILAAVAMFRGMNPEIPAAGR